MHFDKRNSWLEQKPPSTINIKEIEIGFLSFRDYALLKILQLETLISVYRTDINDQAEANRYYGRYLQERINGITQLEKYATFVYK